MPSPLLRKTFILTPKSGELEDAILEAVAFAVHMRQKAPGVDVSVHAGNATHAITERIIHQKPRVVAADIIRESGHTPPEQIKITAQDKLYHIASREMLLELPEGARVDDRALRLAIGVAKGNTGIETMIKLGGEKVNITALMTTHKDSEIFDALKSAARKMNPLTATGTKWLALQEAGTPYSHVR